MSKKNRIQTKESGNSKSVVFFMIFIILVLIGLLVFTNRSRFISNSDETDISISSGYDTKYTSTYFIGQDVSLTGDITPNDAYGQNTSYTHILDASDGKFGLISTKIDLGSDTSNVQVEGKIISYQNGIYVIDIKNISKIQDINETNVDTNPNYTRTGYEYINSMFVGIDKNNLGDWSYSVDYTNERIIFTDNTNPENTMQLDYFACDVSKDLTNCQGIKSMYGFTNPDIVTQAGQYIYQITDTNSRFMENDDKAGYYFSAKDADTMNLLINKIDFMSDNLIYNQYLPNAPRLCSNVAINMSENILSKRIEQNGPNTYLIVDTQDLFQNQYTCKLLVKPELELGLEVADITKKESDNIDVDTGNVSTDTESNIEDTNTPVTQVVANSSLQKDDTITQFKTDVSNTLDFKAREGYTIKFPSKNIRFEGVNMSDDKTLGNTGLYCYVQINVVRYQGDDETSKQVVETDPDVSVYVCNIDENIESDLSQKYFVKKNSDNTKMFLIDLKKPDFYDFAENIVTE